MDAAFPLRPLGPGSGGFLYALPDGRRVLARTTRTDPGIEGVSLLLEPTPVAAHDPAAPEIVERSLTPEPIGTVPVPPTGSGIPDPASPERLLPAIARATGPGARRLLRALAARARAQAAPAGGLPAPFHFGALRLPQDPSPRAIAHADAHALPLEETPLGHRAILVALDRIRIPGPAGLLSPLSPQVRHPAADTAHDRLAHGDDLAALDLALQDPDPVQALQRLHDAWTDAARGPSSPG